MRDESSEKQGRGLRKQSVNHRRTLPKRLKLQTGAEQAAELKNATTGVRKAAERPGKDRTRRETEPASTRPAT